jgi:hypothetical protein
VNNQKSQLIDKLQVASQIPTKARPDNTIAHGDRIANATSLQADQKLRFTLDGGPELEQHLASVCAQVLTGVRSLIPEGKLEGLLLAGGYGRGEGGVLQSNIGDRPYNDLEFYVFTKGSALLAERRYRDQLHNLGEQLSGPAGLEVEFKVITLRKLRQAKPSMFYYDLLAGHRWISGSDDLLAGCEHHLKPQEIPLHEATRLLMNRCTGLLFSLERLQRTEFGAEDADFVGRNLAKARLALGDVLLTACHQYHWSCRERHQRLLKLNFTEDLALLTEICRHHAAGVEFKLHPLRSQSSKDELSQQHIELTQLAAKLWLWLENRRLDTQFATPRDYACSTLNKCPETPAFRNRLVNARHFGLLAGVRKSGTRYPRQRLFHALNLLLWEPTTLNYSSLQQRVKHELQTQANDFPGLVNAYDQLWHQYN